MTPSARLKKQHDHNLTRKAVKIALDDLRDKHAGVLLSAHALKVITFLALKDLIKLVGVFNLV